MAEFRARFLKRAADDALRVEQALAARDFAIVGSLCHGLSGNAGMFGFPDVGASAQAVEEAIDRGAGDEAVHALAGHLLRQIAALNQER